MYIFDVKTKTILNIIGCAYYNCKIVMLHRVKNSVKTINVNK